MRKFDVPPIYCTVYTVRGPNCRYMYFNLICIQLLCMEQYTLLEKYNGICQTFRVCHSPIQKFGEHTSVSPLSYAATMHLLRNGIIVIIN